jgi:hypothetical protein
MAHDIFLGKTKRNWSREKAASNPEYEAQSRAKAQPSLLNLGEAHVSRCNPRLD